MMTSVGIAIGIAQGKHGMSSNKDQSTLNLFKTYRFDMTNLNALSLVDTTIIALIPLTLLLSNENWLYPKYSLIDEWIYVGYGYDYLDPTFYSTNYKISRLPWVLLEAIVRGSLPPIAASWILTVGILSLGNIALYFALKITFGRFPALFACIFIAAFTFMHANGGADYHNTLAGALYCLSMLFCARCAQAWFASRDLVFFGASIALTIHTNPVFLNLVPILVAQYLLCYRISHLIWTTFGSAQRVSRVEVPC